MTEPQKKPSFEQKFLTWQKRYIGALNASINRVRAKRPPPSTEDGVVLATFNDRVFASVIDTLLSVIVFSPVIAVLSKVLHGGKTLNDILVESQEKTGSLAAAAASGVYLYHFMLENIVTFSLMGMVVIYLWMVSSSTPGKWILRMRIVDARTYQKPTNKQFIVRYVGYIISGLPLGLGFFWVGWDKKKQGWHDKIAGTLVIKVKHWRWRDSEPLEDAELTENTMPPSA